MNIVLGFVGENAKINFAKLKTAVHQYVQQDLPLNITFSQDDKAAFALLQPSGFYPLEKPFYDQNHQYLCMLQGYFWDQSHFPLTESQAIKSIINASHKLIRNKRLSLSTEEGGLFSFFCYDEKTNIAYITNDYSGILPLYYSINNFGIYFSTHIRVLEKTLIKGYDPVSIIQQTAFHYTIGKRTLFNDIFKLNPGETLIYSIDHGSFQFAQPEKIYSTITTYNNDNEAVEALHADYERGLVEICKVNKKRGIMLSGGFDTRLVAYGFHTHANDIIGLTLGDPDNFEVNIAQKLINKLEGTHQIYTPVPDCQLTFARIESLIKVFENINFPYCDTGSRLLKQMGAETVSTGYGGDVFFGGQGYSFFGQTLSMKERFKIAFSRSIGLPVKFFVPLHKENVEGTFQLIHQHHNKHLKAARNWLSPSFFHEFQQQAIESLTNDIREEFIRVIGQNVSSVQQVLERFWLEHHILKEFGKQEWTLSAHLPLVLPTVHHSFLVRCSNLPPTRKIDHGIYLKFVKKYFGGLAQLPTANVPLPLSFPIPILWISRALRASYDQRQVRKIMISHGQINAKRSGWSNFEEWFRDGIFLNKACSHIDTSIFSEELINNKILRWLNWEEKIFSGQDLLTMINISQLIK